MSDKKTYDELQGVDCLEESLIEPVVLANSINERVHEIKPTGRKVKVTIP